MKNPWYKSVICSLGVISIALLTGTIVFFTLKYLPI